MQNQRPQFSILIPTTGRGDLIQMALQSVLDQTFQDFEIVVADASRSETIRRTITDRGDARIRYVATPAGGPLEGFDFSAKQARGKYMLWLDDDNYLLPGALEFIAGAIRRSHAEVITANHLYYYDDRHPRRFLRNSLGVVPFTSREYPIDLLEVLRELFAFSRRGAGSFLPRFHTSATFVSRAIIERAVARIGSVLFTDLPNAHSLQVILFTFGHSCLFLDRPVVIVGRLGVSMSQVWSTAARRRFANHPFPIVLSHVTGYTRINGVLENYLRAKHAIPDLLDDIPINYEYFAKLYLRELFYLDADALTALKNWKNFFIFLHTLPATAQGRLRREALWRAALAPGVLAARRLKLHHLWRMWMGLLVRWKEQRVPAIEKFRSNREFTIPLDPSYHIDSIADLAVHVRDIIQKELGRDISLGTQKSSSAVLGETR